MGMFIGLLYKLSTYSNKAIAALALQFSASLGEPPVVTEE